MKINYIKSIFMTGLGLTCMFTAKAQCIGAGGWHSLAICTDSTVKAFGENATGQLGNASSTDSNLPVTASGLSGIIAVSGGGDQLEAHSMALKSNGTVWAWGSNIYGALGNATTTSTNVPGQVLIMSNAVAIAAGGWHSAALKNDGTVWTWGWNTDGQLGDATLVDKLIPTQVPGLTGVQAIAAGTYHMLALKTDGTVWAWGDNVSGQIGDNSTTDRNTPVQVSGLTGIVKISAGRFFSLAVKNDGTVWTWGENLYGQLGDGTQTDRLTPVQVSGLTGITSGVVATGAFHCIVYKNDNTVWAWGRNSYGNLGDSTIDHRFAPVLMYNIDSVAGIAAGTNFTLLYRRDGTFWGCGRNASGQLGDGTFTQWNNVTQATSLCSILAPVGINKVEKPGFIKIVAYPNPSSSGLFTLQIADETKIEKGKMEVYNPLGKRVLQLDVNSGINNAPVTIDLSGKANGVYFMTLRSGEKMFYQKLIKQ